MRMIRKIILMVMMVTASVEMWGAEYITVDGLTYTISDGKAELRGNGANASATGDLVIPSTVSYSGVNYNVVKVGHASFEESTITSVVIPSTVMEIGDAAFRNCIKLRSVVIKGELTEKMDNYIFWGCTALESVKFFSMTPPSISSQTFDTEKINTTFKIYVPAGYADDYKAGTNWKSILNKDTRVLDGTETAVGAPEVTYTDEGIPVVSSDKTISSFYFKRTFSDAAFNAGQWQAMYVPFSMTYDEWKDEFQIAKLVSVHRYYNDKGVETGWLLEVVPITSGSIKPHTPYVVRGKHAGVCSITLNGKTVYKPQKKSVTCWSTEVNYSFEGTITQEDNLNDPMWYVISGGSLKRVGSAASKLRAFRWILKCYLYDQDNQLSDFGASSVSEVRIRVKGEAFDESENEDATGVVDVKGDVTPVSYFSVNGVSCRDIQRGVNIVKMSDGTVRKVVR